MQNPRNRDDDLGTGTDAANKDAAYLGSNALLSLLSECTVYANSVKISHTKWKIFAQNFH